MRITKQPSGGKSASGGRGEFELAEDVPGGPKVTDLLEHDMLLRFGDFELPTGLFLTLQGGKRRFRLRNRNQTPHAGLQAAGILMMPRPIRDEAKLEGGLPVLRTDGYLIHHVELDDVEVINPGLFRARVVAVEYGNHANTALLLVCDQRMRYIAMLWEGRNQFPPEVAQLLDQHQAMVKSGNPVPRAINDLVTRIQTAFARYADDLGVIYSQHEDVVPEMLRSVGILNDVERPLPLEQIAREELDIRIRQIERWQVWMRRRGPASVKFKREVRDAYDWTCIMCGRRLPPTDISSRPGVDAAHILPWADFDVDHVSNGVCLCKLHHWAFDEGLLRIVHRDGSYYIELAPDAEAQIWEPQFSLATLREVVGQVPVYRLPNVVAERPNPDCLRHLYEQLS